MDHLAHDLERTVGRWDALGLPRPDVFVVSGSGLATELGEPLQPPRPWSELLPFPIRGIEGHPLEIELLEPVPGRVILSSRGRLHAYQGFTPAQIVFPARLAALLGAKVMIMTNSAGGLHTEHNPGDLVLLRDHLNLSGQNPLYGVMPSEWGVQFPDMTEAYDRRLRALFQRLAKELSIPLPEGVYASVAGPSYETPAEVTMLQRMGADVVGMSTAQEVIAANHIGLRNAVVSVVANPAAGVVDEPLDHLDVLEQGRAAGATVARLLGAVLRHPDLLKTDRT